MEPGTVAALIVVGGVCLMLGAGWRRGWLDYRSSVATMRASWRAAWWHTWSLLRIAAIAAVVVMIVVTALR
jgi:hypothetical protein